MKSKLYLKSLVKAALISSLLFSLYLSGCQKNIEPTFKETDIPYHVKKICKDEFNLDVTTKRTDTTLWIYTPQAKLLHKEFGLKEDKIFDEDVMDKLRNILTTIGRVLVSADKAPEFYALVATDINIGLDYTIIGNVLDMKKSYCGSIPWTESNRRYIFRFNMDPQAVGDVTGRHLKAYDVTLPDFLAKQIAQRIAFLFQAETNKKHFKIEKSDGNFNNGTFVFEYAIKQTSKPDKAIDTEQEVLNTITYCLRSYEFKDFSNIELNDLAGSNKINLSREAILTRPMPY